MKSKEFIKKQLGGISKKYLGIKIRYEYRESTNSHIIEVIPLNLFDTNPGYIEDEINLEEEFENNFPNENIVFISEDSLTEIRMPDWVSGSNNFSFENECYASYTISSEAIILTTDSNNIFVPETNTFTTANNDNNNNYALAA